MTGTPQKAGDLAQVAFKADLRVPVSDPALAALPDGDPLKKSKRVQLGDIRPKEIDWDVTTAVIPANAKNGDHLKVTVGGPFGAYKLKVDDVALVVDATGGIIIPHYVQPERRKTAVLITAAQSPYSASEGQILYIDTTDGPVHVLVPSSPVGDDGILFVPVKASFTVNSLIIEHNGMLIDSVADDIEVNANGIMFELRYIGGAIGYIAVGQTGSIFIQNATINASDLVGYRTAAGTTITLDMNDREHMVVSSSALDGNIYLPAASTVQPGFQGSFTQGNDGSFTWNVAAASGDTLVSFSNQLKSMGKGAIVTYQLLPDGTTWLIAGGLTNF